MGPEAANPYLAAAQIGGEFAAALQARNAGISLATLRRRGRYAIKAARSTEQVFGGLEQAELLQGQRDERKGFTDARKATELGALAARQTALTQGRQRESSLTQSLVSQGLIGTTSGTQALAGAGDLTTRNLQAIDLSLAQSLAQLNLDEGNLLGTQGRERASLAAKRRAFEQEMAGLEFQLLTSGSITK